MVENMHGRQKSQDFSWAPIGTIERNVIKLIEAIDWPDIIKTEVTPKASVPPRFYGLPRTQAGMPCAPYHKHYHSILQHTQYPSILLDY